MEDILYFLPYVFNRVEIRGMRRPINGPNSILLQPRFDFPQSVNWGIILLEKGSRSIILE